MKIKDTIRVGMLLLIIFYIFKITFGFMLGLIFALAGSTDYTSQKIE